MLQRPLNGKNTHQLSDFAIGVLRDLARRDVPAHHINPGVHDRLEREGLSERYLTKTGRMTRITEVGRNRLAVTKP